MKKEDELLIEMNKEMTCSLYSALQLLYLPLIGEQAYLFYTTLVALKESQLKVTNHHLLQKLCGFSEEAMEKARIKCEEFLLIRSYYHSKEHRYLYVLDVPMKPSRFLGHEVFGRLFLETMGEDVVSLYKLHMNAKRKSRHGYEEISASWQQTIQNNWNDDKEKVFLSTKEEMDQLGYEHLHVMFDESLFLSGLSDMVFPKKERTRKNLRMIAYIATIYGINEKMMKSLIAKGIVLPDNTFSAEKLKKACLSTKAKYVSDTKDPYTLPPRRFLEYRQHGVPLGKADILLIEKLMREYRLQPEVVNVLLDTCLQKSNQRIIGTSVERMAGSWMRLEIDTIEKAFAQRKEELEGKSNPNNQKMIVQEWQHHEETMSEEDKMEMIAQIKQMRGEK